jgi:hypothetical protein
VTAPVPLTEPTTLRAGDTWTWKKSLADYSAAEGWSLRYVFANADQRFEFDSAADGSDHLISQTAANTEARIAGRYRWACLAINGAQRFTVGEGAVEIKPNLAGSRPFETRSTARQIYDALVAAYQERVESGRSLVGSYSIAGRTMQYQSGEDFRKDLAYWKGLVDAEEAAEAVAAGRSSGSRIKIQFTR